MTDAYSTPVATPGTTPRSSLIGAGVPKPVVAPAAPVAPAVAPATAGPSLATIAAGQRQALTPGYDPRASAILNPGGKTGLMNYGGMAGANADAIQALDSGAGHML